MSGSVCLSAERVQAGCQALKRRKTADGLGHVGQRHGPQLNLANSSDGKDARHVDGVLQHECDDERRGIRHNGPCFALPSSMETARSDGLLPLLVQSAIAMARRGV